MADLKPLNLPEPTGGHYGAIDPLDSRYFDPQVSRYLSERARIAYQAHVEAALAQTLAESSVCDQTTADAIAEAATQVTAEEVYEQEKTTRHDIKALVNAIKAKLPESAQPYVHFGATSYDIIANAAACQLRDAGNEVVVPRLKALLSTLIELTNRYADTVQIGRTHGQHGVPITFGFALAGYINRLGESTEAIAELAGSLPGKFSGAVGAYNALSLFVDDPERFESSVLSKLGLKPVPHSTQIVPAEYVIRLLDELAIAAGIMANLSHDMRHLQRTEIGEVRERFEEGQTGSSTMAHKRNPWNFENVISMSKQVNAQMLNANLNISSEHQRDLTDSASSRFYGLSLAAVANMAERLNRVMSKLEVDEEAMQRNLKLTGGAIAAEPLYLLLEKHGHTTAHEKSKTLAHKAISEHRSFEDVIQDDAEAKEYWQKFSEAERQLIAAPEDHYTGLAARKARALADHWHQRLSA